MKGRCRFELWKSELVADRGLRGAQTFYTFEAAPFIHPVSLRYSSTYDALHREAEKNGELDHSIAACPERLHPARIRVWTQSEGWKELRDSTGTMKKVEASAAAESRSPSAKEQRLFGVWNAPGGRRRLAEAGFDGYRFILWGRKWVARRRPLVLAGYLGADMPGGDSRTNGTPSCKKIAQSNSSICGSASS